MYLIGPALLVALTLAALTVARGRAFPQFSPAIVGRIDGDDVVVKTAMGAVDEVNTAPTVAASGSEVTVGAGNALLELDGGGKVSICGPAHFTLLKSGGALTLALDYGRVHSSLDTPNEVTIYTPMIVATPISVSGGSRDITVGLERSGEMCVLAARGAMRVQQQLSGQSLLVPEGGAVGLTDGQVASLGSGPVSCSCEYSQISRAKPESRTPSPHELSVLRPPSTPKQIIPAAPPPAEEPIYTVLMPALTFDASAPEPPPDPSPEMILLMREARVRPLAVFRGHVNAAPLPPVTAAAAAAPAAPEPAPYAARNAARDPAREEDRAANSQPGLLDRVWNFLRRVSGRPPCVGVGCRS